VSKSVKQATQRGDRRLPQVDVISEEQATILVPYAPGDLKAQNSAF
jgi:hypothetical protein